MSLANRLYTCTHLANNMKDYPEFNIFFVSLIEKYRCLYDFNHADYFNKGRQDSAWETIAKEVEEPKCKERWKNLRACYSRHIKSLKYPSPSGPRFKKPYYLAEHLHFIDQFTKTRKPKDCCYKADNAESPTIEPSRQLEAKEESDESEDGNLLHEIDIKEEPCQTLYTPPAKKMREDSFCSGDVKCKSSQSEIESADLSFLKSLLPDMVEMSGEQKRRFKVGILNLAQQILDENVFISN